MIDRGNNNDVKIILKICHSYITVSSSLDKPISLKNNPLSADKYDCAIQCISEEWLIFVYKTLD